MIKTRYYNEMEKIDYTWFDSSMIVFSRMVESETENKGDLYLTYKGGSTYVYYDVTFDDYLVFIAGGTDASHGKSVNKIIKGNYDFEKLETLDLNYIEEKRQEVIEEQNNHKEDLSNTYFISGHRDITEEEFILNYEGVLETLVFSNPKSKFVVGDYNGCDIMAQNYLLNDLDISPERVTVYHMGDKPMNVNSKIMHKIGGFASDEERDGAMTKNSSFDIAFVRDNTKWSGTAQNILRRYLFK